MATVDVAPREARGMQGKGKEEEGMELAGRRWRRRRYSDGKIMGNGNIANQAPHQRAWGNARKDKETAPPQAVEGAARGCGENTVGGW